MEINLKIKILTPLFLGGAFGEPDLRPPSFKGIMRFWFRAVCPDYWKHEQANFGSAATNNNANGQSPFLLRVVNGNIKAVPWKEDSFNRFNEGSGPKTINGIKYLGYPFRMQSPPRKYYPPGVFFHISILILKRANEENEQLRRAVTATCWLMTNIGGMGSRNRRGFGALSLADWQCDKGEDKFPELNQLPILSKCQSTAQWRADLEEALGKFRVWFGSFNGKGNNTTFSHPHFGRSFHYFLSEKGFTSWEEAMAKMGGYFQKFRKKREPDYTAIKNLLYKNEPLHVAPCKAAFGLPLTFRFPKKSEVAIMPYNVEKKSFGERQGSLLFMRPVLIGNRLHPLYIRMDGAVPGVDSDVAIKSSGRPPARQRENCLETFMEYIKREG